MYFHTQHFFILKTTASKVTTIENLNKKSYLLLLLLLKGRMNEFIIYRGEQEAIRKTQKAGYFIVMSLAFYYFFSQS